jgi:hypothetical protein|tara:strand:+ start:104 stop:301 length:198 start_codon:yes stop_codon:yes gene_type:complete
MTRTTINIVCIICRKRKAKLFDGVCKECLGKGANISLMSAIQDGDKELIKNIEARSKAGNIVRIM